MNNYLKKLIKNRLSNKPIILNTLIHFSSRPYQPISIWAKLKPAEQYSDFFVYSTKFSQNIFVAENAYALIKAMPMEVVHIFRFYNSEGHQIKIFNYESNNYFEDILLPSIESKDQYLSFTHEVKPKDKCELTVSENGKIIKLHQEHRGYTIYKKQLSSIGNTVHGNFGHLVPSNLKRFAARQSNKLFKYTPAYKFESDSIYQLVFNNPTSKTLVVNIVSDINQNYMKNQKSISIPKLGLRIVEISNFDGTLSFISKLPTCRAIVFKNPSLSKSNFDVFHS